MNIGKNDIKIVIQLLFVIILAMLFVFLGMISISVNNWREIIKSANYWVNVSVSSALSLSIALLVRSMRKTKKLNNDEEINRYSKALKEEQKRIINNARTAALDDFILAKNKEIKFEEYREYRIRKIQKIKNYEKKKKKREELEAITKEECWEFIHFKYHKITYSKLFASISSDVNSTSDNDISAHESSSISRQVLTKVLFTVVLSMGIFSLVPEFIFKDGNIAKIILNVVYKIIMVIYAIYVGISACDTWINTGLKVSLTRRVRLISEFKSLDTGTKPEEIKEIDNRNVLEKAMDKDLNKENIKEVIQGIKSGSESVPSIGSIGKLAGSYVIGKLSGLHENNEEKD